MKRMVARIKYEDPLQWWERFRSVGATLRESHGIGGGEVFRVEGANEAIVVLDALDEEKAARFLADPLVEENLRAGGVSEAEVVVLERLGDFVAG